MRAVVRQTSELRGAVTIAGSKNYTSRFILAAALAQGVSTVRNPARIDDAFAMAAGCTALGARVDTTDPQAWAVNGTGGTLRGGVTLDVGNAGAVARFLLAVSVTAAEPITITTSYPESLGRRPQQHLLDALVALGAHVQSNDGKLPVTVSRGNLQAGFVRVSGAVSSQYLSGLLLLAPLLEGTTEITVVDTLRSQPAIAQTLHVLRTVGIDVEAADDFMSYRIVGPQPYMAGEYEVPGDWPSAAAVLCAAAVVPGEVTLRGLLPDDQGERRVLEVLANMGVSVSYNEAERSVTVKSTGRLRPVSVDGDLCTDAVLSMVAAAAFAEGASHFFNLHTLRHKESDRISDFCRELRKCGVDVEEGASEIKVRGRGGTVPGGVDIEAYHDHRILMALTIIGLRCEKPLVLKDIQHVAKSFPDYFVAMRSLGAAVEPDPDYFTSVASRVSIA